MNSIKTDRSKNPFLKTAVFTTIAVVSTLIAAAQSHADSMTTISDRKEIFEPTSPNTPRLVFQETKKRIFLSGIPTNQSNYLTDMRFAYDAGTPENIETFAIVQWIRGCMFHSHAENGKVTRSMSIERDHFGQRIKFQHREWEIDSDSTDPIYTNYLNYGRHALLRWNQDPKSLDAEKAKYYGQLKPPHGSVFATDLPGTGFLTNGSGKGEGDAQNVSLEFKICLFKTSDLPAATTPSGANIDQSKALTCVNWDQRFVWDFKRGRMNAPKTIDAYCGMKPE